MPVYKGFSTYNRYKKYRVSDFDLAKQDLYNHLHIRKGEKLMNPDFGTIIWGMLFEPLTNEVKTIISDDITAIVNYDPRLIVERISIAEYENGLQIMIELRFSTTNQIDTLRLQFDRNTQT